MATDKSVSTGHTNPDAITGAPASHPGATGIGSASGAATGAAIGMIGGPIGAIIGAVAGDIVGGGVGHAAGEWNDPSDETYWKDEYKNRSYGKSADFDQDLAPAFRYGSTMAAKSAAVAGSEGIKSDSSTAVAEHPGFAAYETQAKSGWDKVRGTSKLSYDQARGAIADAYDRKIRLHEEQLSATKDRVQTGEARIRKEIITENKTIEVPIEREELVIERHAVSGMAAAGTEIGSEEIRIPLSEERVTLKKDTVVTEEVSIGKKKHMETQTVGGEVRKEKLVVDGDTTSNASGVRESLPGRNA